MEILKKIIKTYPEISPFWLITGEGDMIINNTGIIQHHNVTATATQMNLQPASGNLISMCRRFAAARRKRDAPRSNCSCMLSRPCAPNGYTSALCNHVARRATKQRLLRPITCRPSILANTSIDTP